MTALVAFLVLLQVQDQGGIVAGTVRGAETTDAQAVVYLVPLTSDSLGVDPDTVLVDQRGLAFEPGVIVGRPGLTVEFRNSDPMLHNVFGFLRGGPEFDLGTYPRLQSRSHTFAEPGAHVILCHMHPEMLAWVIVVPSAYHGGVGSDGGFRIESVPPGSYSVRVWHSRGVVDPIPIQITAGATIRLDLSPKRAARSGA